MARAAAEAFSDLVGDGLVQIDDPAFADASEVHVAIPRTHDGVALPRPIDEITLPRGEHAGGEVGHGPAGWIVAIDVPEAERHNVEVGRRTMRRGVSWAFGRDAGEVRRFEQSSDCLLRRRQPRIGR